MRNYQRHVVYPPVVGVLLGALLLMVSVAIRPVSAQTDVLSAPSVATAHWQLVADGEVVSWPGPRPDAPLDSVRAVSRRALEHFRARGHYYATLDSVEIDRSVRPPSVRVHVDRGPAVKIDELRIDGAESVPRGELRRLMHTVEGEPLRPNRLEADIEALLDRYEEAGRPLAQIRVTEASLSRAPEPSLRITLDVDEGPELWLERIEVPEGARTSPGLVARLTELEEGTPLYDYTPEDIRRDLRERDYFETVGRPELRVGSDGGAVVYVPVEEASPGAFDFMLGYLPPSATRESGQVVGRGHLLLKHLFGGGRAAEFTLNRRPGRSSIFDVALSDPYVFGLPLRARVHFRGEQRDSTYGERTFELEAGYRIARGVQLTGSVSRAVVRPGPAGRRLRGGQQQIPRSTALFYGVGVEYKAVDRPQNPRRGLSLDIGLSQGRKQQRTRRRTSGGDTTRTTNTYRQERLHGRIRGYVPLFRRQVLAVGGEGSVLLSRTYDASDLFRLGGATSLRGYDEDRFLGHVVGRGLVEYRLQIDPASYGFMFADVGYVARPAMGERAAVQWWHPGYGFGLRLQTAIGRLTTTYALNPELKRPSNGRVHIGLSVGL